MSGLYRLTASDVSEALWESMHEYGVAMEVGEQAAIARRLAHDASVRNPKRRAVTRLDVLKALRPLNRTVPRGFAAAVENRLRRVLAIAEGES